MRITLNLATRPFADLGPAIKRLRIGMGVLAAVAIGLGFGLHAIHQKAEAARDRDHSLDGQIARINQERESYQALMRQPANAELLAQAAVLNKLFDEKAFSWTLAMEDLETVLPGGVQVATLEPARAKNGQITLHLRVLGPRDLAIKFVGRLEQSRRFCQARIIGETSEAAATGGSQINRFEPVSASSRVSFDVLADYIPPTPEESRAHKRSAESKPASSDVLNPGHGRAPYTGGPARPANAQPFRVPHRLPPPGNPNQAGAR